MKGKGNQVLLTIILLVIVAGAGTVGAMIYDRPQNNELPARKYLDTPMNYAGNTYTIDALIKEQIDWLEGKGRIVLVKPVSAQDVPLLVFIADDIEQNLHVGQRYRMEVVVGEKGLLCVEGLTKR